MTLQMQSAVITEYGVAMISRLLKNIGFFGRIKSLLQGSFAKETYVFNEPTNRSQIIAYDDVINSLP